MSDRKVNAVAKNLIDTKKLIENPDNWCHKKWSNISPDGTIQQCVLSALLTTMIRAGFASSGRNALVISSIEYKTLSKASKDLYGVTPMSVNDSLDHTHVMKMLDRAISDALVLPE